MTIDPRSADFDPAALLEALADATGDMVADARTLDDGAVRAPSALAGWTRGHLLTHLARNADGLCNLLTWAATGDRHEMYPDPGKKAAEIEAGASRPAAEIAQDLAEAGDRFVQQAAGLTPAQWKTEVERRPGQPYPAARVPWWRYEEVLFHHVDLDIGFSPARWPAEFTGTALEMAVEWFGSPVFEGKAQPFRIYTEDTVRTMGVRCDPAEREPLLVRGPQSLLLAWLIGRSRGDGLVVEPFDALPVLPAWM
jgi:maleylpyruvate isomerase